MIKINPSAYSSVFVLPSSVADKHIRLAGAVQLKALVWIFRHSAENPDIQDVSSALGIPCADISDALQYWVESGIISIDDSNEINTKETGVKPDIKKIKSTVKQPEQISFFDSEVISLSKYEPLWRFLSGDGSGCIQFSFERIEEILGFPLDHSFLNYKQEAEQYGYRVEKISLKEKWVRFVRIAVQ